MRATVKFQKWHCLPEKLLNPQKLYLKENPARSPLQSSLQKEGELTQDGF